MMPLFNKVFPSNVIALTSDRVIDFTFDGDQPIFTEPQREFVFSQLNFDLPEPIHIRQVHGDRIIVADKVSYEEHTCQEADGLITEVSNLPIAIRCADCLPLFLYDDQHKGIGLIHTGWKGAQSNIAGQAIELMEKQWQSNPKNIKAVFGPAICSCCYEVGSEFFDYFPGQIITRDSRYYLDLPQMIENQLLAGGVLKDNIFDYDICTCCNSNFFSFRREGVKAGRMISIMMLTK